MPLTAPRTCCCSRKYGCEKRIITIKIIAAAGSVSTVTPVSGRLIDSIMTSTPIICVTDVMSCVTLWLSDCPNVSTSLVIRLSTSPLL